MRPRQHIGRIFGCESPRRRFGRGDSGLPGRRTAAVIAGTVLLLALAAAPAWAGTISRTTVSEKITCQCGCGAVLENCPHEDCGWGVPARVFIEEQLAGGRAPDELVQYYVSQYGEQVLAAPTKSGFNVTAWVTPFIVLIMGAVAIYYVVRLWADRLGSGNDPAPMASAAPAADDRHLQRLEDELDEFD